MARRAGWGLVAAAALCLVLIGAGLLRYPAAVAGGGPEAGPTSVLLALGLLVGYAAAGVAVVLRAGRGGGAVVEEATWIGLVIGAVWLVNHTVEVFTSAGSALSALFFGAVFLLFGFAGLVGARRTGRVGAGVVTAVWAAMGSSLILVAYGLVLAYLFMGRMAVIEAPDFARSGMHDPAAFTVANAIFSASAHLLEAPVIAAVFGLVGSLVGRALRLRRASDIAGRR
jgi:hypothetical protein